MMCSSIEDTLSTTRPCCSQSPQASGATMKKQRCLIVAKGTTDIRSAAGTHRGSWADHLIMTNTAYNQLKYANVLQDQLVNAQLAAQSFRQPEVLALCNVQTCTEPSDERHTRIVDQWVAGRSRTSACQVLHSTNGPHITGACYAAADFWPCTVNDRVGPISADSGSKSHTHCSTVSDSTGRM